MLIFFIIIHGHELFGLGDKRNNLLKINLGWNQFKLNFILTYNIILYTKAIYIFNYLWQLQKGLFQ